MNWEKLSAIGKNGILSPKNSAQTAEILALAKALISWIKDEERGTGKEISNCKLQIPRNMVYLCSVILRDSDKWCLRETQ